MRKKPQNRLGVSVLYRGTFLLSIITVCRTIILTLCFTITY